MTTQTAMRTDPRSYVLPATVTSNIPAAAGPGERGVFAAARGLLLEAADLLGGRPARLHLQDNRGTFSDGHVDITVYATVELEPTDSQPARRALLTLLWGLGGRRPDRNGWTLTMDRYRDPAGRELIDHRHLGSADGRLPAPTELALLIADAG